MKNLLVAISAIILLSISCKKNDVQVFFETAITDSEKIVGKLTPEMLWKFGRILDCDISPDGKNIIYTVKRYSLEKNKGNAEVFIVPSKGGTPTRLTITAESESCVKFSAKEDKIGYLSSQSGSSQIWEMNPDGSNKIQVSDIKGEIEGFDYSPDGSRVFFTMRVKTDSSAQDRNPDLPMSTGRVYDDMMNRHWDSWYDYSHSHIFIAAIKDGKVTEAEDILKGEPYDAPLSPYYDLNEISWSNDGKKLAYTCRKLKGKAEALSTNSDIYIYDIENKSTINISEGMNGYDKYPVFSPDDKMICWTSMETPGYESDQTRLMVYNFETKQIKNLSANFEQEAISPVWNEQSSAIYFISGINATYQLYKADLKKDSIKQLTEGGHEYMALLRAAGTMIGTRMSFSSATEIINLSDEGKEQQVTFENKNIYDNIRMGKVEERWITTTDNKKMLTWVIFPPDFDSTKRYPALLYCQGGPQQAVSQFFSYRWNLQLMAAKGYIIVAPNRRGLPTFGKVWNDQIAGDYGGQNIKDYLSAIDAVKTEPYVDSEHLGAVGASYGGFSVFYLAGHHQKRFKAFIAHCGMFNLESQYASTEEFFFTNHDLGGPYWQTPKPKSYSFSPHLFVQNWDTPIMIISGENDFRIPYTESLQAFNAAQLRGIPSRLLIYPDESHWVVKPQNSVLWQREFFRWLNKWLK
jgi:dipeptidyl aminopeptidase/acylaminoacyl peptidase